jgi:hypothetical protein
MPETRINDYASFLRDLGSSGADYFLEGGQAVNFWAEYYSAKGAEGTLSPFLPFTSKDCDVWVSYEALRYLRSKKEGGRLISGDSPADGQVGVFSIEGSPPICVDIMTNVYGVPEKKIQHLKDRTLEIKGIRVIDPGYLFQSKCHCLLHLDQTDRQDEKHLRMLCFLVPKHIEGLLDEVIAGRLTQRALINELKFLQKILKRSLVKRALGQIEVDPMSLIPVACLTKSGLTKVVRFVKTSFRTVE